MSGVQAPTVAVDVIDGVDVSDANGVEDTVVNEVVDGSVVLVWGALQIPLWQTPTCSSFLHESPSGAAIV